MWAANAGGLMDFGRLISINTRFSLLLQLIDAYTASAPVGNLHVALEGVSRRPLSKSDGCFVFTDLERGAYRLKITSQYYLKECRVITLQEQSSCFPALNIFLKPTFFYPYFSKATCCLASLRKDGEKAAGIRVRGTVLKESCAMARLAQDSGAEGETDLFLNKNGAIPVGDCMQILSKESGTTEYCRIEAINYDSSSFRLSSPLENNYRRGDCFLPVMETCSDEHGEVALYFRPYREKCFQAVLEFFIDDHVVTREVDMVEGSVHNLGLVTL